MPLDQSFVGRSYPSPRPYEVGRETVQAFAEAIGDTNPVYYDPEAARALGHPAIPAPPTFAFAFTYQAAIRIVQDPELGLDYDRVVHREQSFSYSRPVRVGDVLDITSVVKEIKSLAGNEVVNVAAEVTDAEGEHVVTVQTKLVARAVEEGE
ncbi:MaoC family dehydratase N-terminal domain-containing protein [Streptomyces sp. NPDC005438]|uniref:MaoC family dehydratase N-terminal domain-containing protein n=1 Tax=Streptomyces sp. NPDC005438 TaxID=3156880 RepID=UPI0033B0AC48